MTTPQENQPGEAAQDLDRSEAVAVGASSETATLIASITEYLSLGGLFNPEAMDHDKVSDLLLDCRELLCVLSEEGGQQKEGGNETKAASKSSETLT